MDYKRRSSLCVSFFSDLQGNSYALDVFLDQIQDESYDYLVFAEIFSNIIIISMKS